MVGPKCFFWDELGSREPDMEVNSLYSSFTVPVPVPTAPASALAGAIDTVLPQGSQSVAPIAASASSGAADGRNPSGGQPQQPPANAPGQTPTVGQFTRDSQTNSLVFVEIDPETQAVILQFPDEQLLKLRSYVSAIQLREEAAQQSIPGAFVTKTT